MNYKNQFADALLKHTGKAPHCSQLDKLYTKWLEIENIKSLPSKTILQSIGTFLMNNNHVGDLIPLEKCAKEIGITNIITYKNKLNRQEIHVIELICGLYIHPNDYSKIVERYTSSRDIDDLVLDVIDKNKCLANINYHFLRHRLCSYLKSKFPDLVRIPNNEIYTIKLSGLHFSISNYKVLRKLIEDWLGIQIDVILPTPEHCLSLQELARLVDNEITQLRLLEKIYSGSISAIKLELFYFVRIKEVDAWIQDFNMRKELMILVKTLCKKRLKCNKETLVELQIKIAEKNFFNLDVCSAKHLPCIRNDDVLFYHFSCELELSENINKLISEQELYQIKILQRITKLSISKLEDLIKRGKIIGIKKNEQLFISKKELDRINKLIESYIGINEYIKLLNINTKYNFSLAANREKLKEFMEINKWFNIDILLSSNVYFIKTYGNEFYIKRSELKILEEHLIIWLLAFGKTCSEKIHLLIKSRKSKFPKTCQSYKAFLEKSGSMDNDSALYLLDFLLSNLTKDIQEYNDLEIDKLAENMYYETTLQVGNLFSKWIYSMNGDDDMKFLWNFKFNKRGSKKYNNVAYELSEFSNMAYCIFNESYWNEANLIQKATSHKRYADLWLYTALHFICALRDTDLTQLPHPKLPYAPEEVIKMIRDNRFSVKHAEIIVMEITLTLNCLPKNPYKTLRYKDIPYLKLLIPESAIYPIGLLFALTESHYQLSKSKKETLIRRINDLISINKFFGATFANSLNGRSFSARRANKSYLQGIERVTDIRNPSHKPKGYMLAAIARSHKGDISRLPETISKYLCDANFSGYTPEFIAKEMFERGVCSFITSLLLEMLCGNEFLELSVHDQTNMIKQVGVTPNEIESIMIATEVSLEKAKEILREIVGKEPGDMKVKIECVLQNIATGSAVSKQDDCLCLMTAQGKLCVNITREHCIGCGYEIYTKSTIYLLSSEYKRLLELSEKTKDIPLKNKYNMILKTTVMPAILEIFACLRSTYKISDLSNLEAIIEGRIS